MAGGGHEPGQGPAGGDAIGRNPTDRGKSGSKHHVLTEARGIPLNATVTGADLPEATQVFRVLTAMPAVGGKPGPKRQRPKRLQGDRGYDSEPARRLLRWLGITPVLAARYTGHGSGLGVFRWFVERTISWFHQMRRLRTRYDRRIDMQYAFLKLGAIVVSFRFMTGLC